jgi:hypothetical protein
MITKIYAVHDIKADAFGTPIFQANDEICIRSLSAVVCDTETTIGKNPEDFNLYNLGAYNNETGLISTLERPELICSAVSLIQKELPLEE